jgi:hypothetical protein
VSSNEIIEALADLVANTLRESFAPNECGCDENLWKSDASKIPAEATPFAAIQRLDSELIKVANGWPREKLSINLWIVVKPTADLADSRTGLEGRAYRAKELLEAALLGNVVLGSSTVMIRPNGKVVLATEEGVQAGGPIPLTLEYAR